MNDLTQTVKIGSMIRKTGIQGARESSRRALLEVKPEELPNRYAIGFDDSGSMAGDAINDAHKAIASFCGVCSPLETSVAIYPFNAASKPLTNMFDVVTAYVNGIGATGNTPLYTVLGAMLKECNLTRAILFSDGRPTDHEGEEIDVARNKKIPVDCCYIGYGDSPVLKSIAESTGGIYLVFDSTTSFAKNMKYLSPKYVALLANAELKERIQKGETI